MTKDYVSYSIHSIKMQRSNLLSNQFEEKAPASATQEQQQPFMRVDESSSDHQASSGNYFNF